MTWERAVQAAEVTAEQMVVGRIEMVEYDARYIGPSAPDMTRLEYLRARWPEWGDASAAVLARLRALDDLRSSGMLDGVNLLEGSVMAAAAQAPIAIVDIAWALDWPRFIAIAHDADRSEMQGLELLPMDEIEGLPPEAANDDGGGRR